MVQDERVNTHYKDTVFRLLFSDKARLLSLYNALSERRCDNIDELKVVTLKDAIYMEVKHDIAFLIGTDIHMYEHQSTINPNMPLRFLEYIASEYQRLTDKRSIYSRKLVKLPTPHFVVFYNGIESTPDHSVLKLSASFEGASSSDVPEGEGKQPTLELLVDVYNINAGHNGALQEACATLKGYADFVQRTRDNQRTMPFAQALSKAVDECIKEGILADFLRDNKAEVIGVSIFEFDREEHERIILAEEREESEARGAFKTLYELVKDNLLSLANAARKAGQSEEEFKNGMEAYFAEAARS